MNRIRQFTRFHFQAFLIVAVMSLSGIVIAADEDMISQVYLEFDPETGEFVTARDPMFAGNSDSSKGQDHVVEQIQAGQDAMVSAQKTTGTPASAVTANTTADTSTSDAAQNSTVWIAGIGVLVLVGGILVFRKKGQHTT